MKRQAIEWRKYLKVLYTANRGLVSKVYRELSNQIIQLEKWAKDANRLFTEEVIWVANKYMKNVKWD